MNSSKESDLEFSPSGSNFSPTDDTLAKATAVDNLWRYKIADFNMTTEEENKRIRHLAANMDYKEIEIKNTTCSPYFIPDLLVVLSRSNQIESLVMERVVTGNQGLDLDLRKLDVLQSTEIQACEINKLRLPGRVASLSLDRCKISIESLESLQNLQRLKQLSLLDLIISGMTSEESETVLTTVLGDLISNNPKLVRIHTSIDFTKVDMEAKKYLLKVLARNSSIQFMSFKPCITASIKKGNPSTHQKTIPHLIYHNKSSKNVKLFSQGKEEIQWSIGKPNSIDRDASIEQLQLVSEAAIDPFNTDNSNCKHNFSSEHEDGEDEEEEEELDENQFISDFIDCNMKANRFISREGVEELHRIMLEDPQLLASKLSNYQLSDVIQRLIYEKIGLSPLATHRNTCNEEMELNQAKDSARNSDGKAERDLNSALKRRVTDFTQIKLQTSQENGMSIEVNQEKNETNYHQDAFTLHSMKPMVDDTLNLRIALEQEINNPFSLTDRFKKLNKIAECKIKQKETSRGKSGLKNLKQKKSKKLTEIPDLRIKRRKSTEEHSVRRKPIHKEKEKAKKSTSENKGKFEMKKKSGLQKERKLSINKINKSRKNSLVPRSANQVKVGEVLKTDRDYKKAKLKSERAEKGHGKTDKENIQLFSNRIDSIPTSKDFTFDRPIERMPNSSIKISYLKDQNIHLTSEKTEKPAKRSKTKKAVKKQQNAIR